MKSKITKKPEIDDDDIDVESTGPSIAAAKKSKIAVIAASSVLITVVLYFLFFKTPQNTEKLEEVAPPKPSSVAPSEEKSPFELETKTAPQEETPAVLAKPATPEVPTLPDLPVEALPPEPIVIPAVQPTAPTNNNAAIPAPAPNQNNAAAQPAEAQQPDKTRDVADPRYAPIIVFGGGATTDDGKSNNNSTVPGVGYDNNIVDLSQNPIEKLDKTAAKISATRIDDMVHTIAQGKLLTAVLETAINTEIPGSVRGVISRDVYGEAGNEVLIPRGSRLFGSYSSKINQGQGRVEISWSRLIRPDGVDLAINFNASDQFGRSGIPGDVDNKYGSIITTSMLTSILAVGGVAAAQKLLTNNSTTTTTTNPTQGTTTTTGSATNQAIYDVSKTIIDTVGQVIGNTINVSPVIRVPQGTRITVIVNGDIVVPSMRKR